jgi:hypothetical protein
MKRHAVSTYKEAQPGLTFQWQTLSIAPSCPSSSVRPTLRNNELLFRALDSVAIDCIKGTLSRDHDIGHKVRAALKLQMAVTDSLLLRWIANVITNSYKSRLLRRL